MPDLKDETKRDSARRVRAMIANAAGYPAKRGPHDRWEPSDLGAKPSGKGPRGWRRKSPADESMTRGVNGWLATVKVDGPGRYMATVARYFNAREDALEKAVEHSGEWKGLVHPELDNGKRHYRLAMSRVFDDCDEAMAVCDEVME